MVFAVREDAGVFGDIALEEYGELVLKANNRTDLKLNKSDDWVWFAYTDTPGEQEIYYLAACYKGQDAYWVVNFATPSTNYEKYSETFMQWAASIDVGKAA